MNIYNILSFIPFIYRIFFIDITFEISTIIQRQRCKMDAEETIRQQGKSWNYKNLTTMAQTLEEALKAEFTDFLLHKNSNNYFLLTPVPKAGGWTIKHQ